MTKNTRAKVPPPPGQRTFLAGSKPAPAADNMSNEKLAPMTFNMPRNWHAEFKATAAVEGMSMKDLLVASFDAWRRNNR